MRSACHTTVAHSTDSKRTRATPSVRAAGATFSASWRYETADCTAFVRARRCRPMWRIGRSKTALPARIVAVTKPGIGSLTTCPLASSSAMLRAAMLHPSPRDGTPRPECIGRRGSKSPRPKLPHDVPVFVVAPVMHSQAKAKLRREFDAAIAARFQFIACAVDSEKDGENVKPGIGGSVYELLGLDDKHAKNRVRLR